MAPGIVSTVHYSIEFFSHFFAILKKLWLEKRGNTPTNIADEHLKMIKTGIFVILLHAVAVLREVQGGHGPRHHAYDSRKGPHTPYLKKIEIKNKNKGPAGVFGPGPHSP